MLTGWFCVLGFYFISSFFTLFYLFLYFTKQIKRRDRQSEIPTICGSRLNDVDQNQYQANEQQGPAAELVKH